MMKTGLARFSKVKGICESRGVERVWRTYGGQRIKKGLPKIPGIFYRYFAK
jgi:hypothetical protein